MTSSLHLTSALNERPLVHKAGFGDGQSLLAAVDAHRLQASQLLNQSQRSEFGQFLTPLPVARLMAMMLRVTDQHLSILDAGAGIGTLGAAVIEELCQRHQRPQSIHLVTYEVDSTLISFLKETLRLCQLYCEEHYVTFTSELREVDFVGDTADRLESGLFRAKQEQPFDIAIQNPPYRKINTDSSVRRDLRRLGLETTNLYTGFLGATIQLLKPGGQLVAITPRSFCNGPYFRPFRRFFLERMALDRLHLFDSRQSAFRDDRVLQETIIMSAVRATGCHTVRITSSPDADSEPLIQDLAYNQVVRPTDPEAFIHVVQDGLSADVVDRMSAFTTKLGELGLRASTGPVVDFRVREFLSAETTDDTVPLLYPANLVAGYVQWPMPSRKPIAIVGVPETRNQLVANDNYVVVKRFSSKEEKRRVVAAVHEATRLAAERIGIENHLNYFHQNGKGLDLVLARGLAAYLNSTLVDSYFRQFNGHTQVNATDLRNLPYPTAAELRRLGARIGYHFPNQDEIDRIISEEFMPDNANDPIAAKKRIEEAMKVLTDLGLPKAQLNERSALTLLALLNLAPENAWSEVSATLIGITPIMDFMKAKYGKEYAANTRETVRRFTVHQFVDAGLVLENPDDPKRPTNSPKTVYQIEQGALELIRTYGSKEWGQNLRTYRKSVESLKTRYAQERDMKRIPLTIREGVKISLSPGGQNVLVEQIMKEFAERFTPGGKALYVGDTDDKYAFYDKEALATLGVVMNQHGKMPDVIIHYTAKNWLVLIEAVTSHGPVNPKRQRELKELFRGSKAGLVLVTAFLNRKAMAEYLPEISWETEVWCAEDKTHLIHFNGERFLGPYEDGQ